MDRATKWSVTINMKNVSRETAEECIARARQSNWEVIGQIEKGESGTEHYQLALKTPQVRFTAVKKMFPTAHIEVAKDWNALLHYVQKEDTRVETLKKVELQFVTFKMVRDKFFEWFCTRSPPFAPVRDDEQKLSYWDQFIGLSIQEGIECDVLGVNPQYRSCIMRYWDSYIRRQTDRQTQENLVQDISIPTFDASDSHASSSPDN